MRNPLSETIVKIPPSGIRKFFDIVSEMKDAISLGVGEPDFDTPWHIREEGIYSLERGKTFYTSNAGLKELKQEIAHYQKRKYGVMYDYTDEIVVTVGGMMGMYMAILALVNPGDEILIADPSYTNYVGEIVMNRAVAVPVPVYEKDNFNFTYENLKSRVTDKTKAIILNSPCNPTGGVATRETMETVAKVALEYDLYVIYDAVYKHLIYNDTDYINIAVLDGMRERTIYVDSFSKTYAMTGWRLGYMAGPRNILSRLPKLQENMPSCLPEFVQYAGIEALKNGDEDIAMMNRQYAERRKLVLERINGIKGLSCTPPNGAFYAFVNIKETGMTSVEFCEKLLEKEGVVTAPGSAFGEQGEGYVRLSYATSMEQINRGMDRIQRFMESIM